MVIQDVKMFSLGYFTLVDQTGTYAQPRPVAIVKEVSIEWGASTKELRGTNAFPEEVAVTERKITGKAKLGTINGKMLASLLPGSTVATGSRLATTQVVSAAATITASLTSGHSDLGVLDATGKLMVASSSATAVGIYTVTTGGVYTFNAAETGDLTLNYSYTVTTGFTVSQGQVAIGTQTSFKLNVFGAYTGNNATVHRLGVTFYSVKCPKLATAFKIDDFTEYDIDFECFFDQTANKVFDISTSA